MLKKLSIISVLLILLGFLSSTVLATSDMSNYMRDAGNNIGEAARNTADGVGNVVENTWDATKNTASAVGNASRKYMGRSKILHMPLVTQLEKYCRNCYKWCKKYGRYI